MRLTRRRSSQPVRCSFCGKAQSEVARLIGSEQNRYGHSSRHHNVYICNECVDMCNDIMEDETNRPLEE